MRSFCPLFARAVVVLMVTRSASATYYGQDTTISTDTTSTGGAILGFDDLTLKTSPCTVTVVGGGITSSLSVFAGSTGINNGGDIGSGVALDESLVFAFGDVANGGPSPLNALLQVNSGTFLNLQAGDNSHPTVGGTVLVDGGQTGLFNGSLARAFYSAYGQGVFTLSNGNLNGQLDVGVHNSNFVPTTEAPTVNLNGGSLTNLNGGTGTITASDSATVNLVGTAVSGNMILYNSANFAMTGGSVAGALLAHQNAVVSVSGGTLSGGITAFDNSSISVSAELFGPIGASSNATVELSAKVHGSVSLGDDASLSASQGAIILGDLTDSATDATNLSLDSTGVQGNISVTGPVQFDLVGASVVGGDVTLTTTAGLFLPHLNAVDPTIHGNLFLNGFSQASLNSTEIDGGITQSNASDLTLSGSTTEIKQSVLVNDSSTFHMSGGSIGTLLAVADQATADLSGGTVELVNTTAIGGSAHDGFTMEGGSITTDLAVAGNGTAAILSGEVGADLEVSDSAHADIVGASANIHGFVRVFGAGSVDFLQGFATGIDIEGGDGTVALRGGTVFQNVEVNTQGKAVPNFEFDGGLIGFDLNIRNGASAFMNAGEVADSVNVFSSRFRLSGGKIDNQLIAHGNSIITIDGGQIGSTILGPAASGNVLFAPLTSLTPEIFALDQSSIEIDGTALNATLIDPNFTGNLSEYSLSGFLGDGSDLGGLLLFVQNPVGGTPGASFTLVDVPEPATLTMFLLPAAGLLRRKSLRRR